MCLGSAGVMAFIVGLVVFFGWAMKDRKSDLDPTALEIAVSVTVGSVILASSICCFIAACRMIKRTSRSDLHSHDVR